MLPCNGRPSMFAGMKLLSLLFALHVSMAFTDLHATPEYKINFLSESVYEDALPPYGMGEENKVEIMRFRDQAFFCTLPDLTAVDEANQIDRWGETELAAARQTGIQLLSPLSRVCLYHVKGWWTYSFCYGKEIRQFHVDKPVIWGRHPPPKAEAVSMNSVLGDFEPGLFTVAPTAHNQHSAQIRVKPLGDDDAQHALAYHLGKGSTCEITGKARTTEVQFVCNPKLQASQDRIALIKEVKTCHYLISIHTSRLCKHPVFLPPKRLASHSINCQPVVAAAGTADGGSLPLPVYPVIGSEQQRGSANSLGKAGLFSTSVGHANFDLDFPLDRKGSGTVGNKHVLKNSILYHLSGEDYAPEVFQ